MVQTDTPKYLGLEKFCIVYLNWKHCSLPATSSPLCFLLPNLICTFLHSHLYLSSAIWFPPVRMSLRKYVFFLPNKANHSIVLLYAMNEILLWFFSPKLWLKYNVTRLGESESTLLYNFPRTNCDLNYNSWDRNSHSATDPLLLVSPAHGGQLVTASIHGCWDPGDGKCRTSAEVGYVRVHWPQQMP